MAESKRDPKRTIQLDKAVFDRVSGEAAAKGISFGKRVRELIDEAYHNQAALLKHGVIITDALPRAIVWSQPPPASGYDGC